MTTTENPFTVEQYRGLNDEQKQALEAVAGYLGDLAIPAEADLTDDELSSIFNLLKPCEGCAPPEEFDGASDILTVIRKKFGAVYEVGLELAEAELKLNHSANFCMVVDPSYEDSTHVAIVDYQKPICHLHEWVKPWNFTFINLKELADAVLSVKKRLVEIAKPTEIFVVMEGGIIHEIVNQPENLIITVLDYDIEGVEKERVEISPLDGEPCTINKW